MGLGLGLGLEHPTSGKGRAERIFLLALALAGFVVFCVTAGGWGPWIVGGVVGGLAVFDIKRHPVHTLRWVGGLVLVIAVLIPNTALGGPTIKAGQSFAEAGQGIHDALAAKLDEWRGQAPAVQFSPPAAAPAPTTTVAPPVPPAQPAALPRSPR